MVTTEIVGYFVAQSDPPNLVVILTVWWRLDRRLQTLREEIPDD